MHCGTCAVSTWRRFPALDSRNCFSIAWFTWHASADRPRSRRQRSSNAFSRVAAAGRKFALVQPPPSPDVPLATTAQT